MSFRDPSVSFDDARKTALLRAQLARQGAEETFNELKRRMEASNPLRFFLLIDALQRVMRLRGSSAHGYDPLQEMVGGILTSLNPDLVMSRRRTELSEVEFTAMELLVRQLAAHASQASVGEYIEDEDERGIEARFLLAAEERFDRTAGYTEHLRTIAAGVLGQLDDLEPEIGFRLGTVLDAADAHLHDQLTRLQGTHTWGQSQNSESASSTTGRSAGFAALERLASAIDQDPVAPIAAALSGQSDVVSRLLDSLATPLGTQHVTSLSRSNRLRQFPVIKLSDGTYIWTSPQDCLHELLEWADLYLSQRANPAWRRRLSRARAATTERLTAAALAEVYGPDRVVRNLEYREADGSWIETDVVVDLGTAAVIVEAKSQRITPQGRSATTGRVRSKIDEFLIRPLSQTSRASRALTEGVEVRARRRELGRMRPSVVRRIIVNLDRVDPFVSHARSLVDGSSKNTDGLQTDAWIVSLADLLTVTDLLRTPTELWAYHGTRAAQTATGSPIIFMESDALGAWIKSREGAWPTYEGNVFQLAFSSEEINAYYNSRDFSSRDAAVEVISRPTSRIPGGVLDAMTTLIDAECWHVAADAIANVSPTEWERFGRGMQRLSVAPRTRSQRRSLAAVERGINYGVKPRVVIKPGLDPDLQISMAPDHSAHTAHDGPSDATELVVTLVVPRSLSTG